MSGHTLSLTITDAGLRYPKVTCTEPPNADCHLTVDCECETFGEIHTDGRGKYHVVDQDMPSLLRPGFTVEIPMKHRMTPDPDRCNIRDWLENSDCVTEDGTEDVEVVIPFEPVWAGDYYEWKPLTTIIRG